jgi:hypothetical protein
MAPGARHVQGRPTLRVGDAHVCLRLQKHQCRVCSVEAAGPPERGASALIAGVDVTAPVDEEGPDGADMAPSGRAHERRVAISSQRRGLCARPQQQLHHGLPPVEASLPERTAAGPVPLVHLRPLAHQVARDVQVAVKSSAHEGCVGPVAPACVEEPAIRPNAGLHGGQVGHLHISH